MNEADKAIIELEESVKDLEETILGMIPEAESGNEQVAQKLNELKGDMIVLCKPETILRLAEYFCLSIETSHKARLLCEWLRNHSLAKKNVIDCFLLSGFLPAADTSLDYQDRDVRNARIKIGVMAEGGYALAQYWHGRLIEDGNSSPLQGWSISDALRYYHKAAEQGVAAARKRLSELAKRYGCCPYCGGDFKGLFKKVCRSCGKPKDY